MCLLPKLDWVRYKLLLTEAAPRKKGSCYLGPKGIWFMWPGYFLETSFPSPCYPGEGLRWEVLPKDCSTGKLAVCFLAMSGSLCWQLEESARGLMSMPHPGRRSYSSLCTRSAWGSFFLLKSMCWLPPLCGLKPTPCPSHSGLCLRMLTLMTGSLSSLGSWIMAGFCMGEAPAGDRKAGGERGQVFLRHVFPALVLCLSSRLSPL